MLSTGNAVLMEKVTSSGKLIAQSFNSRS